MEKRKRFLIIFLLSAVSILVNAQTAEVIETFLRTQAVNNEQAAWFVLLASDDSGNYNDYSYNQAFRTAVEKKWLPRSSKPTANINLRNVSFLIMRAFDIKGGPMYTIFRTPHYAYREMLQSNIIQGRTAPGMNVSGDSLLYMIGRVLFDMDENPWELPPEPEEIIIVEAPPPPEVIEVIPVIVEEPEPVVVYNENSLAYKLQSLESNAQNGGKYIFEVSEDETMAPCFLYYGGKTITITIKGDNVRRKVSLNAAGTLFSIGTGVTLILDNNITIAGRDDNKESLIIISSGNLILNNGAEITGNTASYGGGVHFMNGTFTMNGGLISGNTALNGSGVYVGYGRTFTMNGGIISGNTAFYGGGVYVSANGTFDKTGGIISGNTASQYGGGVYVASDGIFNLTGGAVSGNTAINSGGGVYISNGIFNMKNGEISGNTAGNSGGGVYIFYYGIFNKTGGLIYGATNDRNSNSARDIFNNILLKNMGHAVYASIFSETSGNTIIRRREGIIEAGENLSLTYSNNMPFWSGRWE